MTRHFSISANNPSAASFVKYRLAFIVTCVLTASLFLPAVVLGEKNSPALYFPLNSAKLRNELSLVRGTSKSNQAWPRTINYSLEEYDFRNNSFRRETRTFVVKRKPRRIMPHSAGVAEILWAICPRERLLAFNDISADPDFSFIAHEVRASGRIFRTKETEALIGLRPDLVFIVSYSNTDFKEKLKQTKISYVDLGYFGSVKSIKEQILLIGSLIGEEGNAAALVKLMDNRMADIRKWLPESRRPRVLYYDQGGYVPGEFSNFNSICEMLGAVNVGAERGIRSWSQIDRETLLKWNPDVIIVPDRTKLKKLLASDRMLASLRAVKNGAIYDVPGLYLQASSQYILLSADYLASLIYRRTP